MEAFSALLERLYFTNSKNTKTAVIHEYLRDTPDPDRGWAIAALAGTLNFDLFKRALIKSLILERADPVLFELSYDYVGEMSETVAHLWPNAASEKEVSLPSLSEVVNTFKQADKQQTRDYLVSLLNQMTPAQRWALVKLGTRGLRVGVSARLIKRILADYGGQDVTVLEQLWHGIEPPYTELLAWLEGRAEKPDVSDKVTFHPVMLAHPLNESQLDELHLNDWQIEWKYDGIRVQLVSTPKGMALFSRTGDDISASFPDLLTDLNITGVFDGELLIINNGVIGTFNDLQQRLNKKKPSKKLQTGSPAGMVIYDALAIEGDDLSTATLATRRQALERWFDTQNDQRLLLSNQLKADSPDALRQLRTQATDGDKNAVEGLMLKRRDSVYTPGRPANQWLKWKREPFVIDAVMMYAQRGHGKRSSYYSDYTFGVWQEAVLVPVGKAYSGFTDEELKQLDRWVRQHTVGRFGPVKEVEKALVLEVAFDSAHSSSRHKSGIALRFPRIKRIRWDKPAAEADSVTTVAALIG
ncbi:cisplatin damage response ATP-dependent DNA ligase [Alteromonas oceanisediminis]|uniref:cisplatin damage response ATP-dependent DNA ligase n=1 Tax=Alteromonas oceanisediminis TaxID=2836180 RepID=UPI001BD97859|nr:cisplatin damage response ATP-dependent DNA ligase [Alteromonas oceanisediminis]MBT0586960.1 cisplatin damage response ATP-dependent DNA ligase [Alteromonas oceanisediminis]